MLHTLLVLSLLTPRPGLAGDTLPVTRRDVGRAFLDYEIAYLDHPPGPARIADANRAFDQTTLAFFRGSLDELTRGFCVEAAKLRGEWPLPEGALLARSLGVRFEPPVQFQQAGARLKLRVGSLFELRPALKNDLELEVVLLAPGGEAVRRGSLSAPAGSTTASATFDWTFEDALAEGRYPLEVRWGESDPVRLWEWTVVSRSLDALRREITQRLDRWEPSAAEAEEEAGGGDLEEAVRICRARADLLQDVPSDQRTAEFLFNPLVLRDQVLQEVDLLERGVDPYRRRAGDLWRTLPLRATEVPMRLFAPPAAAAGEPLPLVIAYHGAGADENLFMDGYGGGLLVRLAAQRGFLLVTPQTGPVSSTSLFLDRLLESLEDDYEIDRDRVYVLGHSMGTGTAAGLAFLCPDRVTAACCLAGFRPVGKGSAPVLVIAGRLDPIMAAQGIERAVETAKGRGADVTLRMFEEHGHTLLVLDALPEVVEWLLSRRRTGAASRGGAER